MKADQSINVDLALDWAVLELARVEILSECSDAVLYEREQLEGLGPGLTIPALPRKKLVQICLVTVINMD